MKPLFIPCVALCCLGLSGCHVVYSARPLSTSEDAVEEPALEGRWTSSSDNDDKFCIQKTDNHTYTLTVAAQDEKSEQDSNAVDAKSEKEALMVATYQITLVRLEDQLFADMVAKDMEIKGTRVEGPVGSVNHHVIIKLDLTDSELRFSVLDPSAVRQASEQGYAPLPYFEIDDGLLLTASTEDLRFAVSHYADRLFEQSDERFTRINDGALPDAPPCIALPPS